MGVHIEIDHDQMSDIEACNCNEKCLILLHVLEVIGIGLYEITKAVQPQNASSSKVSPWVYPLKSYSLPLIRFQLLR